jgi:hypothetical protein
MCQGCGSQQRAPTEADAPPLRHISREDRDKEANVRCRNEASLRIGVPVYAPGGSYPLNQVSYSEPTWMCDFPLLGGNQVSVLPTAPATPASFVIRPSPVAAIVRPVIGPIAVMPVGSIVGAVDVEAEIRSSDIDARICFHGRKNQHAERHYACHHQSRHRFTRTLGPPSTAPPPQA